LKKVLVITQATFGEASGVAGVQGLSLVKVTSDV